MLNNKNIIKTISYSQDEILSWIMKLYVPDRFDCDPTYGKGNFYKKIPEPLFKIDLNPQNEKIRKGDSRALSFSDDSLDSIIFDPPFTGGSWNKGKAGIIKERFGYYKNIPELWEMYYDSLKEFHRILKEKGILVFKCQDTVESSKQYFSHIAIMNMAVEIGFYPKDLFILLAKTRLIGITHHNQQHARKFHSYFWVFLNMDSKILS